VSPLVRKALETAGIFGIARARLAGETLPDDARAKLEAADLLALGALADAVRAKVAGDVVRFVGRERKGALPVVHWVRRDEPGRDRSGLDLLRRIAVARVLSPDDTRIGVNYTDTGLEIAQVALGFGASELTGVLANKRGLPIADDATKRVKGQGQVSAQLLQQKELEQVLAYVGRRAVFVDETEPREVEILGATHA